jgi:hypothetical protein
MNLIINAALFIWMHVKNTRIIFKKIVLDYENGKFLGIALKDGKIIS